MHPRRHAVAALALASVTASPLVVTDSAAAAGGADSAVVYLSDADNPDGLFGIYAAPENDLAHPHPVLATGDMNDVEAVKLSPDGGLVAFLVDTKAGSPTDTGDYSLQVMSLSGLDRYTVVAASHTATASTLINGFSWDGSSRLVVGVVQASIDPSTNSPTTTTDLREVGRLGGAVTVLPNTSGLSDPAVSFDGSTIAATYQDPDAPRGQVGLRTYDVQSGTVSASSLDIGDLAEPSWSHDDTRIVYAKDTSTNASSHTSLEVVTRDVSTGAWSAPADLVPVTGSVVNENPTFAANDKSV